MHRIVVRVEAEADMREAARWYDGEVPGLGAQFLDAVSRAIESIAESPLRYPSVEGDTRRALMPRFPFLIYFTVESDTVFIMAALRGRRSPETTRPRAGDQPPGE